MKGGYAVQMTAAFQRDYQRLAPNIQEEVNRCVLDVETRDPLPAGRRPHSVTPRGVKPTIYTLDVTANKAYKLSFHLDGHIAILRRVATHRQIDRSA